MGENGNPILVGIQPKQYGKLWGAATHSPKYETYITGPIRKSPFLERERLSIILIKIQINVQTKEVKTDDEVDKMDRCHYGIIGKKLVIIILS